MFLVQSSSVRSAISTALNVLISLLPLQDLTLPLNNRESFQELKTKSPSVVHLICAELSGLPHSVPLSATPFYLNIINLSEPEASTISLLSEVLLASFVILFLLFSKRTDLICQPLRKILKIYLDFFILGIDFL